MLALLVWGLALEGAFGEEAWTLERCLGQALAHNPDAQLARHRIAIGALRKALALPQLDSQPQAQ